MYTIIKKVWRSEGLAIESPASTRLCLMILYRFCSYLCCLSMRDSYNFRLCFWATKCNSWAKQHCPTHSIVVRWGQNVVDCSYFFNFECCIIATQSHWKMLMVVNHMPFLSWVYICAMFVKLYATMMHQCVYGNLIPIMLRIVYLAEPPYGIIYVY